MKFYALILSLCIASAAFGQTKAPSKTTTVKKTTTTQTRAKAPVKKVTQAPVKKINTWIMEEVKGDELVGTVDEKVFYYEVEGMGRIMWGTHSKMFLRSFDGIFDYEPSSYYDNVDLTVGFYDKSNNLVKKMSMSLYTLKDDSSFGWVNYSGDILNFLKDKSGTNDHVRILASRYGKSMFDLTVPMLTDEAIAALKR